MPAWPGHNLSFITPSYWSEGGFWENAPTKAGFPYGEPPLNINGYFEWTPFAECLNCPAAQTENHKSCVRWRIVDNATKNNYVGALPFDHKYQYGALAQQVRYLQLLFDCAEKWAGGWWSVFDFMGRFHSTLFNAVNAYWQFAPNCVDGVYFDEIVSTSGRYVTLNATRDPRRMYFGQSPMQVGDLFIVTGQNVASLHGYRGMITGILGFEEGLSPECPETFTVQLDKDIGAAIATPIPGVSPYTAGLWIARRYNFPYTWLRVETPSWFYGVKRTVKFSPADEAWASGHFTLKNASGADCAVYPPVLGSEYFSVRKKVNGEWVDIQMSGQVSTEDRVVLCAAKLKVSGATWIHAFYRADTILDGLSNFSSSSGGFSDFAKINDRHYMVKWTPTVTNSRYPVEIIVSGGTEDGGLPAHEARLRLDYNPSTTPVLDSSSAAEDAKLECSLVFEGEDGNPVSAVNLLESDFTLSNAVIEEFSGSGPRYVFSLMPQEAWTGVSVQVNAGVSDEFGNASAASNSFDWAYWGSNDPDEIKVLTVMRAPYIGSHTSASSFSVHIKFVEFNQHSDPGMKDLSLSDIVVLNGAASNLVKIDANNYTVTITPQLPEGTTEGAVTITIPAGVVEHDYYDQESPKPEWMSPPSPPWPGVITNGEGVLEIGYATTGSEVALEKSPLQRASDPGVYAHVSARFSRPVLSTNLCSLLTFSGDNIVGAYNLQGTDTQFEFDVVFSGPGTCSVALLSNRLTDRYGLHNQTSNILTWTIGEETPPGSALSTTCRFFITQELGDRNHETCISHLYLRDRVNGVGGYEDLLADAEELEVAYYWETTKTDYKNRPCLLGARRCRNCIADTGGVWGYTGPDGLGFKWFCTQKASNPQPTGLNQFGAACFLFNTCNRFSPLNENDFLSPEVLAYAMQQMWTGTPGSFCQRVPGSASRRNFFWQTLTNPGIMSLCTPVAELSYPEGLRLCQWTAQGSGLFYAWDGERLRQGVAHDHTSFGSLSDPNNGEPRLGILPYRISEWRKRQEYLTNNNFTNNTDLYGEARSWYLDNSWARMRGIPYSVYYDIGPFRTVHLNQGHSTYHRVLLPDLATGQSEFQQRTYGGIRFGWFNADLQLCDEADALYGALIKINPHPYSSDYQSLSVGDPEVKTYTYEGYVAWGTIWSITLSGEDEKGVPIYKIECDNSDRFGVYYIVIPGKGPQYIDVRWYSGGTVVEAPEIFRTTNGGYAMADFYVGDYDYANFLGPAKGAKRGYNLVFMNGFTGAPLRSWPFDANHTVFPVHTIVRAECHSGEKASFTDWTKNLDEYDDSAFYAAIANCVRRPPGEEGWATKRDVLYVADRDGVLGRMISSGLIYGTKAVRETLGVGTTFLVCNAYAAMNPWQSTPDFFIAEKGTEAWTPISADNVVALDRVTGVFALKKEAMEQFTHSHFCLSAYCEEGLLGRMRCVSAESLNQTMLAYSCLDTIKLTGRGDFSASWGFINTRDWNGHPTGATTFYGPNILYDWYEFPGAGWGTEHIPFIGFHYCDYCPYFPDNVCGDPREVCYFKEIVGLSAYPANGWVQYPSSQINGWVQDVTFTLPYEGAWAAPWPGHIVAYEGIQDYYGFSGGIRLFNVDFLQQIPDGVEIEHAEIQMTALVGGIVKTTTHHYVVMGPLAVGNPEGKSEPCILEYGKSSEGYKAYIAGLPYDVLVASYFELPDPSVDDTYSVNPVDPKVTAMMLGVKPDGTVEPVGFSVTLDASYGPNNLQWVDVTDILRRMLADRKKCTYAYYGITLAGEDCTFDHPYKEPDNLGVVYMPDRGWFNCTKVWKFRFHGLYIAAPSVGWTDGFIQYRITPSVALPGKGPNAYNFPPFT